MISYLLPDFKLKRTMKESVNDPHLQKEHTEIHKILKFGVNQSSIYWNKAIYKRQHWQRNKEMFGHPDTALMANNSKTVRAKYSTLSNFSKNSKTQRLAKF